MPRESSTFSQSLLCNIKKSRKALVAVSLAIPMVSVSYAANNPLFNGREYVSGELIIKLKQSSAGKMAHSLNMASAPDSVLSSLPVAVKGYDVLSSKKQLSGLKTAQALGSSQSVILKINVDEQADIKATIEALQADSNIAYVQPNYIRHQQNLPTDPRFGEQWFLNNTGANGGVFHIDDYGSYQGYFGPEEGRNGTAGIDIGIEEAWKIEEGSSSTVVAVIDGLVDIDHPDLKDNIWVNSDEIPGNGKDDDGNGYVDDVNGYDFIGNKGDLRDVGEHGTHVAGIIGASCDNGIGVCGVNKKVSIMSLGLFSSTGGGDDASAIKAIYYAVDNGARVINASWGGPGGTDGDALMESIQYAGDNGVLFVTSAGNDGYDNDTPPSTSWWGTEVPSDANFPASYTCGSIVAVASSGSDDELSWFSNYGATTVDVAAPGSRILSTLPGSYGYMDGTSMASPVVTGIAALLFSQDPSRTAADVKKLIMDTVDKSSAYSGKMVTGGRVNVFKALSVDASKKPEVTLNVSKNSAFTLDITGSAVDPDDDGYIVEATLKITGTITKYGNEIPLVLSKSGTYYEQVTMPKDVGDIYEIEVSATDNEGKVSVESAKIQLGTIPNTAPQIAITKAESEGAGCITIAGTASDSDIGDSIDSVIVRIFGVADIEATVDGSGDWTAEKCGLSSGAYKVVATAFDTFGASTDSSVESVGIAGGDSVFGTLDNHVAAGRVDQYGFGWWWLVPETEQYKALKEKYCHSSGGGYDCSSEDTAFALYLCPGSTEWTDDNTACAADSGETDIALEVSSTSISAVENDFFEYDLTIKNNGAAQAAGVYLTMEQLTDNCSESGCGTPGEIQITSVDIAGGSCEITGGNAIYCPVGSVDSGSEVNITVTGLGVDSGNVYLSHQVDMANQDTDESNNSVSIEVQVHGSSTTEGEGEEEGEGEIEEGEGEIEEGEVEEGQTEEGEVEEGQPEEGVEEGEVEEGQVEEGQTEEGQAEEGQAEEGVEEGQPEEGVEEGEVEEGQPEEGVEEGEVEEGQVEEGQAEEGVQEGAAEGESEVTDGMDGGGAGGSGSFGWHLLLLLGFGAAFRFRKRK